MDEFIKNELEGFGESGESDAVKTLNPLDGIKSIEKMISMPRGFDEDVKLTEHVTNTIEKSLKKKETILLLVVDEEIANFVNTDFQLFELYVSQQLAPWSEDTLVDPYSVLQASEAIEEYADNAEDYPDESEFYMKFYGGWKTENGDIVSQINENAIFETYDIQNINNNICNTFNDVLEMIVNETINFRYILHEGKLCDKNNTNTIFELPACNPSNYFVVIKCFD
jgi:hypothetical protein